MPFRFRQAHFSMATGGICLLLVLLYNPWTLAPWLAGNGELSAPVNAVIRVVDLGLIGFGALNLLFRKKISAEVLLNIDIMLIALLFCYGVGEAYVRTLAVMNDMRFHSGLRVGDDYLHHTLGRNLEAPLSYVTYYTNSLGFRDASVREIDKKTPSRYRIVVLGDSFAEAAAMEYPDMFTAQMERLFRENGKDVEVLNAGVVSLCPSLEYRKLKHFLDEGYTTDAVTLMLDISDIEDEAVIYDNWEKTWQHEHWTSLFDLKLRFVVFLRDRLRIMLKPDNAYNPTPAFNIIDMTENPRTSPRGSWTESDSLFDAWGALGVRRCQQHILEIAELCRAHDILFTMAIYPWPQQLTSTIRPSRHQVLFSAFAEEHDLPLYDFFSVFYALPDWNDYFIPVDVHWNKAGHILIAERLYEFLTSMGVPDR